MKALPEKLENYKANTVDEAGGKDHDYRLITA